MNSFKEYIFIIMLFGIMDGFFDFVEYLFKINVFPSFVFLAIFLSTIDYLWSFFYNTNNKEASAIADVIIADEIVRLEKRHEEMNG